jgi:hypothetical protein
VTRTRLANVCGRWLRGDHLGQVPAGEGRTGRSQLPLGSAGDPSSGDGGRAGLAVSTAQTAAARRRRAARLDRANGYPLPRISMPTKPLCRRHRAKQTLRWHLEQTEPGVMTWTLPHGRTYATRPDPLAAAASEPVAPAGVGSGSGGCARES